MFFPAKFASAQEGPMVRRGSGGGAGVGTPPHTMPCQHHASTCARPLRRTQKSSGSQKKHVDTMPVLCYYVDEKMNLDKKKGDKETMNVKQPLYRLIARAGDAARYCEKHGNTEWQQAWEELLEKLEELLPYGSGFDAGTKIEHASASKIVLRTSFHHMNENG